MRFGVSPFGIYRPGTPAGIVGLDAYEAISCDPVTWLAMDWVDYVAPQLYWRTTQTRQAFGTLLPWWASLPDGDGRFVLAGMNLAAFDAEVWTLDEYRAQTDIVRAHLGEGAGGSILYHLDPLVTDDGVKAAFTSLYARNALPPPVVADPTVPAPPRVVGDSVEGDGRGFAVYVEEDGAFVFDTFVPGRTMTLSSSSSRRAIAVVGKNDRESRGIVIAP